MNTTILVVDDERSLVVATETLLVKAGYSVISAFGGVDALEKSRAFKGEIQVLLVDVMMPDIDGLKVAQQVFTERPTIRVLLMSADPTLRSGIPLLRKPFRAVQLFEAVQHITNGSAPSRSQVFADDAVVGPSIHAMLRQHLEAARRRYLDANGVFLDVTKESSDIPSADGLLQLEMKARSRDSAFNEYLGARQRLETYLKAQSPIIPNCATLSH